MTEAWFLGKSESGAFTARRSSFIGSLQTMNMEMLDETPTVISAGKVTGGDVYNTDGERPGIIHDVMINKRSGKIDYALMSFGAFLGIGERNHPLPWMTLKCDTRQGGYVAGLTTEQLREAPTYSAAEQPA